MQQRQLLLFIARGREREGDREGERIDKGEVTEKKEAGLLFLAADRRKWVIVLFTLRLAALQRQLNITHFSLGERGDK